MRLAKDAFISDPNEENCSIVSEKKKSLEACNNEVEEESLIRKIAKAEKAADRCKNKES